MMESRAGADLGPPGVLAFSFSLPATRLAVEDLDADLRRPRPRLVAAALPALLLALAPRTAPPRRDLPRFALVGLGVVIGFPLFTSLALRSRRVARHVVVGLLPAATAAGRRARRRAPAARVLARGAAGLSPS